MIDVEQLTDEECYLILQKAERYASDILLKRIEEELTAQSETT